MASQEENSNIPTGWFLTKDNLNGKTVKCYTNVLGQKYYSIEDLMRYVNYAQEARLSIYAPGFNIQTANELSSGETVSHAKSRNMKSKKNRHLASKPEKQAVYTSAMKSSLENAFNKNQKHNPVQSTRGQGSQLQANNGQHCQGERSSDDTDLPGKKSRRLSQLEPDYHPDLKAVPAQEVSGKGKQWASSSSSGLGTNNLPDFEVSNHQIEVANVDELVEMLNSPDNEADFLF